MELKFVPVEDCDLVQYKLDMQEAFKLGAIEGGAGADEGVDEGEDFEILPESDIDRSLSSKGSAAYKAVMDGSMVGGAIVVVDEENKKGHLDFLYVKHGIQSRGIGSFMWFEIEKMYPDIKTWETCTPYFEKRNIHFYVNTCGFHIVEFYNERHKDSKGDGFEMFEFRKEINKI